MTSQKNKMLKIDVALVKRLIASQFTWTFFKDKSRDIFRNSFTFDTNTWTRAHAWTLWKALIIAAELTKSNVTDKLDQWRIIEY